MSDQPKKAVGGQWTVDNLLNLLKMLQAAERGPMHLEYEGKPILNVDIDRDTGEVVIET